MKVILQLTKTDLIDHAIEYIQQICKDDVPNEAIKDIVGYCGRLDTLGDAFEIRDLVQQYIREYEMISMFIPLKAQNDLDEVHLVQGDYRVAFEIDLADV